MAFLTKSKMRYWPWSIKSVACIPGYQQHSLFVCIEAERRGRLGQLRSLLQPIIQHSWQRGSLLAENIARFMSQSFSDSVLQLVGHDDEWFPKPTVTFAMSAHLTHSTDNSKIPLIMNQRRGREHVTFATDAGGILLETATVPKRMGFNNLQKLSHWSWSLKKNAQRSIMNF